MRDKFVEWYEKECGERKKVLGFVPVAMFFLIGFPTILVFMSYVNPSLGLPLTPPLSFVFASVLIVSGISLSLWTVRVQFKIGRGTPVPVMPTRKLITEGPYAFCRNPMTLGIIIYYTGISVWLSSLLSFGLTLVFILLSISYIKLVEEKELEMRFGDEYKKYKERTPFLVPGLKLR